MSSHDTDRAKLQLAAIVSSSDDAIVSKDLNGIVISWNRAAERIFGFSEAEAVGQSIRFIIPKELYSEEDEVLRRIRAGLSVERYETFRIRKDGQHVNVSLTVSPVETSTGEVIGASTIARDITESKRLERDAERLSAIVDSSDDAIVSKDLNSIVLTWNRAAEEIFGYTAAEMIGQSIRKIIPDDRQSEEDDVLARIRRGERVEHYETIRCRKDGTPIPISVTISPMRDKNGTVIGASKIARDISERKKAEAERQRLLQVVQNASRLKDEFLATLSHELRTPLNAIVGYIRMMRSGLLTGEKQVRALETVDRNATSLTQIVEDVLDVSRIIQGKIRLNVQPLELPVIVQEVVETVRPAADAKGIRIETILDPRAAPISGDPERLQQVLWNLLSNAVKFTDRRGRVQVRLERMNSHVEIAVSDTGVGIAPEFLPHVFERFRQGDAGINREHGGLGLGLAITRTLVEMQGGRISVASDGPGKGSTFRIELPVMIVQTADPLEERRHPVTDRAGRLLEVPNLTGVRILAVDDDSDALALLREILEATGATVTTAGSAEEALRVIESANPNVLLADLGMPRVNGFELLNRVRASENPTVREVPAAALTAYARSEDRAKALRNGFQMHLAKPIEPGELMAAVAALIKRPAPRPAQEADAARPILKCQCAPELERLRAA